MNAREELESNGIYNCPECKCALGDDWEYEDFSNKTVIKCPQCGHLIYTEDFKKVEEEKKEEVKNKMYCPDCCKEVKPNELLIGIGGCVYCPKNSDFTKKVIEVKKVGEDSGNCREYYQKLGERIVYAKVTHPNNKDDVVWYSTDKNGGEPECPIKQGISFKVVPSKKRPNLQKIIDSLEKQINNITTDYDCNITRRRAQQLRDNVAKQDRLRDFQNKAKLLNHMWEKGIIPLELQGLATVKDLELLSYPRSYPTDEQIESAYEHNKEDMQKNKNKFDKWGLDSNEKVENARMMLNELKLELSEEEKRAREIKKVEDDIRGARIPGFFPTPENLIDEMIVLGDISASHEVLEPSAGKGDMVDVLKKHGMKNVDCIEINHSLKKILELKGCNMVGSDFLEFDYPRKYDRIIMNPPFENLQDIDHIRKAYDCLKDGGVLVSVMGSAPFFRSCAKAEAFRDWISLLDEEHYKNDADAFKKAFNSTGVNTYMIKITKRESAE